MVVLKNILLLTVIFGLISFNVDAQKGKKNTQIKALKDFEYQKDPPMEYKQEIPKGVNKKTQDLGLPIPGKNEDIIDYFINEMKDVKHFSFFADNEKDTIFIHVDSLLPMHKSFIDNFIKRYNKQEDKTPEDLKKSPFKNIDDKISALGKIGYKKRNQNQLDEVLSLIEGLADSKQKVELLLAYADLNIHNETYYPDVYSFCDKAKKYADGISDLYEKGKAYTSIGEHAAYYRINDFAIQMFYLARESIDNSNTDAITKYNEQGYLCEQLAWVFYTLRLEQSIEKEGYYLANANQNFVQSGNNNKADIAGLNTMAVLAELWTTYWRYNPSDTSIKNHNLGLNALQSWYKELRGITNEADYLGFFSIALSLEEKSEKTSLLYYLRSLPLATFTSNLSEVIASLENISLTYTSLGRPDLAIGYSDLELYLADKVNSKLDFNNAFLNKATTFYEIKEYDSALKYVNKILADTSLKNIFYPSFYNQLLEEAYRVKYQSLDFLKQGDSARVYEKKYTGYQMAHLEDLVDLIEVESKSISDWFERSKGKEISNEKELRKTAEKNSLLQIELKKQENKLRLHAEETASLALKQKNIADSLLVSKDSILILRDSIRKKENTANAREKDDILKNAAQKLEDDRIKSYKIYGALAALIAVIVGSAIAIGKRRKQKYKKQTAINAAEFHRVNELAKNKIHNFRSDITDIDNLINKNNPILPVYMNRYKEFLRIFFRNWDKQKKITLAEELEELESYCEVKKMIRDFTFNKEVLITNPEEIHFLQSVFDTLLDNSIKHGFADKTGDCIFAISVKHEGYFIICEINDNGIPPESNDAYFLRQNRGLNILRNRLRLMYTLLGRQYLDSYFIAKAVTNPQGTYIKLTFPYEKA